MLVRARPKEIQVEDRMELPCFGSNQKLFDYDRFQTSAPPRASASAVGRRRSNLRDSSNDFGPSSSNEGASDHTREGLVGKDFSWLYVFFSKMFRRAVIFCFILRQSICFNCSQKKQVDKVSTVRHRSWPRQISPHARHGSGNRRLPQK